MNEMQPFYRQDRLHDDQSELLQFVPLSELGFVGLEDGRIFLSQNPSSINPLILIQTNEIRSNHTKGN
jgi:hypothetical protein